MTLVRGLLLMLVINVVVAQKNLEEVPVQPDFDVHKVSVMAMLTQCCDKDWVQVTLRVCSSLEQRLRQPSLPGPLADMGTFS